MAPGNYSDDCWIAVDDLESLEERFQEVEGADIWEAVGLAEQSRQTLWGPVDRNGEQGDTW
jgi:hypothetical protein